MVLRPRLIHNLVLVCSTLTSLTSFAGDDPCTANALSVGTTYSALTVTNSGATNSAIAAATCDGGSSDGDIWYSATVGANGTLIIETRPGTLTDVGMALYTGSNCSTLVFHSCIAGGTPGFTNMPYASLSGLTPASKVWIRLWDVGNDQVGTFNISAYVNCSASVSISGPATGCSSSSSQLCATAGFSSYVWTGGTASTCLNVNSTGTFTVTVTDADGCTASASHSYTSNSSPTVSITGSSSQCSADNPQLCVASGFSSYSWSNGGTTNCINPASTGGYTVTVTNASGCTGSDTKLVSIYTSPSISISGPAAKCSNSSDQFCIPSGYSTYSWSTGATTPCINPLTTATYSVTISDVHGCTATASKSLTVNAAPVISVTGPSNACPGTNPQLCVASGYSSYSWSNGGTINCITPANSASYSVTVTDSHGCTGSNSKSFTYYPAASVSITGPSSACSGASVQLCATGGFAGYSWSSGQTTSCINPASSNNYIVTVTDANGCTGSDSHAFTVDALPSSTISGPPSVCNGGTAQLCAPAGNASYLWSNNSTGSCMTAPSSGNYSVVVTGTNGCTSSSSHTLTVYPAFAMNISGPSAACSSSNPQLCASSGSFTYQWSNGSTSACITPAVSGTYSVVATNNNGCTATASKGFTIYPPLNASINGPSSACTGSSVQLCATSGSNSYVWNTGATSTCINVNTNGMYSVTITDINGCSANVSKVVTFSSSINVQITGPPSGCTGSLATLCVPSGYASYAWNTGATTECIDVGSDGTYSVTIHDQVGCVANGSYNLAFSPPPVVNITGSTIVCAGSLVSWCATPGFASYLWSNGGTASCINVSVDTTYTLEVVDSNGCTSTVSSHLDVVNISPGIFESNGILFCDAIDPAYQYEWQINGQATGCTGDSCVAGFSGLYSVIVTDTLTGCSEIATYNYISNGVGNLLSFTGIFVYPNPFTGNSFTVRINDMSGEEAIVVINDALGRTVFYKKLSITDDSYEFPVNLEYVHSGLYLVNISTTKGTVIRKVIGS